MSSIYLNKNFATFWNERAGDEGEPYKKYVLDPIMLNMAGSLRHKVLLELGCGNGYLAAQFLKQHPKKIILTDISKHNLSFAAQRITNTKNVELLRQDATKRLLESSWCKHQACLQVL